MFFLYNKSVRKCKLKNKYASYSKIHRKVNTLQNKKKQETLKCDRFVAPFEYQLFCKIQSFLVLEEFAERNKLQETFLWKL